MNPITKFWTTHRACTNNVQQMLNVGRQHTFQGEATGENLTIRTVLCVQQHNPRVLYKGDLRILVGAESPSPKEGLKTIEGNNPLVEMKNDKKEA